MNIVEYHSFVNTYMIHFDELKYNFDKFPIDGNTFCFDTETCCVSEEVKDLTEKGLYRNIEGDVVKVYAWALSNTKNNYVLYGERLEDFFNACVMIFDHYLLPDDEDKVTHRDLKRYKKLSNMEIYVHNLTYDFEFIKYFLLRNEFVNENVIIRNNKKLRLKDLPFTFGIAENGGDVYSSDIHLYGYYYDIENKEGKIERNYITSSLRFKDSFKIISDSLDSIANNVLTLDDNFKKKSDTYDYEAIRHKRHKLTTLEKEYLYNDVYILKEVFNQFYPMLETKHKTASSIAYNKMIELCFGKGKEAKQIFKERYPSIYGDKEYSDIVRNSYKGGYTIANPNYISKLVENIKGTSIDINSSYPSAMYNNPLPYGTPKVFKNYVEASNGRMNLIVVAFDAFENKYPNDKLGHFQATSLNRNTYKCNATEYLSSSFIGDYSYFFTKLPSDKYINVNHKCIIPLWEFEFKSLCKYVNFYISSTNHELNEGIHRDDLQLGYKILETYQYKCDNNTFKPFIDHFTNMKIEGKKEGNPVKTKVAKLMLNSCYGKFASRIERNVRPLTVDDNGLIKYQFLNSNKGYYETDNHYYPPVASAVTAYGRVNLKDTLYQLAIKNDDFNDVILYCDTDSIYTTLPVEVVKEVMGDRLHPTELGKWDIEKDNITHFLALGAKKYMCTNNDKLTCKCAGLPKAVRDKITYDTFFLGATFEDKLAKRCVPGGCLLSKTTFTISNKEFGVY